MGDGWPAAEQASSELRFDISTLDQPGGFLKSMSSMSPQETGDSTAVGAGVADPPAALLSRNLAAWFRFFGPGAIVASVAVDSGEMIFPSPGGAIFGHQSAFAGCSKPAWSSRVSTFWTSSLRQGFSPVSWPVSTVLPTSGPTEGFFPVHSMLPLSSKLSTSWQAAPSCSPRSKPSETTRECWVTGLSLPFPLAAFFWPGDSVSCIRRTEPEG